MIDRPSLGDCSYYEFKIAMPRNGVSQPLSLASDFYIPSDRSFEMVPELER